MTKDDAMRGRLGKGVIPIASGVVLICLFASSWITFDRVRSVIAAEKLVSHTLQVRASLESIYGMVAGAESDQRAYLLTGDRPSLDRYQVSEGLVQDAVQDARNLTKDNPSQAAPLAELGAAIKSRYQYMARSTKARDEIGLDEAIKLLSRGEGMKAMGRIRDLTSNSIAIEEELLIKRRLHSSREIFQAEIAFVLSLGISVLLISAFGFLSNRLVVLREEAADDERASRARLEEEVERTRAAESRLARTLVELKRSNEELQDFAFVASHDLQEPLRKIRAFADRVRRRSEKTMDEESKDSLIRIESAADRMQHLILALLDLSRIATKARPHSRVDLNAALAEVVDDLQTRLEETGGTVVYKDLPTVTADSFQVRQLLQNLVANALKFRREGVPSEIRIEGKVKSNQRVEVRVSDNGIGFDPKYADRIFIVFQRLHGRGEFEGSGIGLAIVRKIVERHGGMIEAQGRPGEGATFVFDLPGKNAPLAQEKEPNEAE